MPALDDALLFPGMTHLLGCRATGQKHGEEARGQRQAREVRMRVRKARQMTMMMARTGMKMRMMMLSTKEWS